MFPTPAGIFHFLTAFLPGGLALLSVRQWACTSQWACRDAQEAHKSDDALIAKHAAVALKVHTHTVDPINYGQKLAAPSTPLATQSVPVEAGL
jgi:hypothetical protein